MSKIRLIIAGLLVSALAFGDVTGPITPGGAGSGNATSINGGTVPSNATIVGTDANGKIVAPTFNPGTDVSNCTASTASPIACSKALSVPSSSFQGLASVGTNIATRQMFFGQSSAAGANYTFLSQIAAEAPFESVQLLFASYGASYTVGACSASSTPVLGSNGTSDTWYTATFSSGNVKDLPPTYVSTTAGITVPAATGSGDNLVPGWAASDWINFPSVARSDGGTLPLLAVRCWLNSASTIDNESGQGSLNAAATQSGRVWWSGAQSDSTGVYSTQPASNAAAPGANGLWIAPLAVRFAYVNVTGLSLVTVGDSITRGQSTSTRSNVLTPYAQYAVNALSTAARPITLSNMGWSGQAKEGSYRNTLWAINNIQPDVILFSVNSINDSTTDFSALRSLNHAIQLITQARANGAIPIIVTMVPSASENSTSDAFRISVNNKVRALAGSGVYVLDADAILTNGATPARIQSGYDGGDAIHPNAAGYAAVGTALQTILTTILNGR